MRRHLVLFRLTASLTLAALLSDAILPRGAVAQPAPPLPEPDQAQPSASQADPPVRVGRVARLSGTVSFRTDSDAQWAAASVNYPASSGDAFWTEPSASAELEVSGNRIVLAGTTEFDIATLDSGGLQAVAAQGEVYIDLRDMDPDEAWSVQTPRGLVHLNTPGRYNISVGSTEQPTRITVVEGSVQIDSPDVSLSVAKGQTATIDGTSRFEGSVGPMVRDPFLIATLDNANLAKAEPESTKSDTASPQPAAPSQPAALPQPAALAPLPAQVAVMPGGSDLAGIGAWSEVPEYGPIWYPPVSSGWIPYREGRWAFISPWGWTWIDNAPWGFAPFHYGRWVEIAGRWCWTPGRSAGAGRPVYAPALVAFVGLGAGVAVGATLASRSIGWVPLGPREPFRPWYHASDRYIRAVNGAHALNIDGHRTGFVNQRAAVSMPGLDMVRSRPVQSVAQPITEQEFAGTRPIIGQHPVRPTAETAGVTPAAMRAFNLPLATILPRAPGPVVNLPPPGAAHTGFGRPPIAVPRRVESNIYSVGGSPPFQPGRAPGPNLATSVVSPPVTAPQLGQRPPPPTVMQRTEPYAARPGGIAPGMPRSGVGFVPGPVIRSEPQPLPQVVVPSHLEPRHFAPPPPSPPPRVASPAQVPHFMPQAAAPRPEPPRVAAPAPRPEPPRPAGLPSAFRPNRPGDR